MSNTELPGQPRLEHAAGTVYRIGYRFVGARVTDMKTPLWRTIGVFSCYFFWRVDARRYCRVSIGGSECTTSPSSHIITLHSSASRQSWNNASLIDAERVGTASLSLVITRCQRVVFPVAWSITTICVLPWSVKLLKITVCFLVFIGFTSFRTCCRLAESRPVFALAATCRVLPGQQ